MIHEWIFLLSVSVLSSSPHDLRWHWTSFRLFYMYLFHFHLLHDILLDSRIHPVLNSLSLFSEPRTGLSRESGFGGIWHIGILLIVWLYPISSIKLVLFPNCESRSDATLVGLRISIPNGIPHLDFWAGWSISIRQLERSGRRFYKTYCTRLHLGFLSVRKIVSDLSFPVNFRHSSRYIWFYYIDM